MKKCILFVSVLLIVVGFLGSCNENKRPTIINSWTFEKMEPIEGKEISKEMSTAIGLLMITSSGSNDFKAGELEYYESEKFESRNEDGEVYQKGNYKVTENHLIMNFNDGDIEEYEIIKLDVELMKLKSDTHNIIFTFSSK